MIPAARGRRVAHGGRIALGHDEADRHAHQARVEHVPVQAARHDPDVEAFQHARRGAAEPGHEVHDVLDDREPEAAERAVHEAVHHVVDLVAHDQVQEHEPGALEELLDDRRRQRRPPPHREPGRREVGEDLVPPAGVQRERRRGERAPQEGGDRHRDRLALVEIEGVDQHAQRRRVDEQQEPRQRPARARHRRQLPERADHPHHAVDEERGEHPERGLAHLEDGPVVQCATVRRHQITAPSIIVRTSSIAFVSSPFGALASNTTEASVVSAATTMPSIGTPSLVTPT